MSLILEALRKSEAERRLGGAPNVMAAMPVLHARAPGRGFAMAVGGVVFGALCLVSAGIWLHVGAPPASVRAGSATTPESTPPPRSVTARIPASDPVPRPLQATAPRVESAPRAPAPPPLVLLAHRGEAAATPPTRASNDSGPRPIAASVSTRNQHGIPPERLGQTGTMAPSTLSVLRDVEPSAPVMPVAGGRDEGPALLPLSALTDAERSVLPPLKVSMHVFADDPSQRFMLIDGQRAAEGDRLGGGVILVHIRRVGAEIDVRGQRLFLPNP